MSKRPNILWIFGDQHRGQSIGCAGDPNVCTPNLDRMSIEGMHFTQAISNNPWCCPFRFTMMTGLWPHQGVFKTPMGMDPELPTVATHLNGAGYRTHYVGKWHLSHNGSTAGEHCTITNPETRGGFHSWIGYENNNSQYDCWVHGHEENGDEIDPYRLAGYETADLTDLAIAKIRAEAKRQKTVASGDDAAPFFLSLSVQPPHGPCLAPPEDMGRHTPGRVQLRPNVPPVPWVEEQARRRLAGYHAQIENLDAHLGRIYAVLREEGILDDTEILFFSDHGDCMGSHGFFEKSSPWEESIRIPFLWAGGVPYRGRAHGQNNAMISAIDIAPTTLGIAGIEKPDAMGGFDFSGVRSKGVTPDGAPESVYIQQVVRKGLRDGIDRAWRGVVTADGWKYTCLPNAPLGMYHLKDDPYELCNLSFNTRFKDERARLHGLLQGWIERSGDDFTLPEL